MTVKLQTLVDEFSKEMLDTLEGKELEGWRGWNWKRFSKRSLETRLQEHVARAIQDPEQWIDVANFCAFLWWRARKENEAAWAEKLKGR